MPEENMNQEFRLKKIDDIRNHWKNKSKWINEKEA